MQFIADFDELISHLASRPRARIAVACPHDDATCEAIDCALEMGFADFLLVGDPAKMRHQASEHVAIEPQTDADAAARAAVEAVRTGRADVLMKGLINTDNLLRAVLNKETGILPAGAVLTHLTCAQIPGFDRLIFFSDAAVIPFPTLDQKVAMIRGMVRVCRGFGIDEPRIALIHCSEKVNPKFPVTVDYVDLVTRARAGEFGRCIIDGPMDVKTACEASSGQVKGIDSPIEGRANGLIFPDIEAGNVFYKTISCFSHSLNAGMLVGASAPVVLPSRSDSTRSKLCSMALACLSADNSN